MINFKEYQEQATTNAIYPGKGRGNWSYPTLALAGETSEMRAKLKGDNP